MTPSITEAQVLNALGSLLSSVLPQLGGKIVIGQTNRVPTLLGDYIVMWPLSRPRLATNYETPNDTKFTASIVVNQLTVSHLFSGAIEPGNQVFGVSVGNTTTVQSQSSGTPGGAGVYVVSGSQNVGAETMSAGTLDIAQSTETVIQCDVHGSNGGDNAQVVSTIIRSEYAVEQMSGTGVTPLYSDDPRQLPFVTAAQQYEDRWMVDVHLQITPTVSTPQEFADAVDLSLVDVDVAYPD